ncbi:hypothetical protein [Spiroplasma sp. DGKH1]|uniref:hypothetical protein n=1 Tax=Spiroplasma sp. DGKH1 TaxID=3050074 RepID=UPI0034C6B20A
MNNWDSLLLYPLLTILIITLYGAFLVHRHLTTKKQWSFIIQHFLFWLALSIILNLNYNFMLFSANINWKNIGILFAVSASFYATIFFIPASWITGLLNRRFWFWLSYLSIIIGIIVALSAPHQQVTFIICALLFGIAIASNSIWYLCFNEVYLYRSNSFLTVSLLFPVVIIANLSGANLLNFVKSIAQNQTLDYYLVFSLMLIFTVISCGLCFNLKEQKAYQGAFNVERLKLAKNFSWWKVGGILVILFFVGLIREFSQGDFYNFLLAQQTWVTYHDLNLVKKYLHLTQELWWIAQIMAGGLLYPIVVKKWGIRNAMMIAFSLWIVYFLLVSFTKVPELWLVGQLLNGFAFAIIFTIIFSLAIVWNYRISRRPVTGYFSALNAFTTFVAQLIQRAISTTHHGLFNNINVDWNLPVVQDDSFNLNNLHLLVMIILMVCLVITLLLMIFVFFTIKHLSGEYFSRENHDFDCRVLAGTIKPAEHLPGVTLSQWIRPDD